MAAPAEGWRKLIFGALSLGLLTVALWGGKLDTPGGDLYLDGVVWITAVVVTGNALEWFSKRKGAT